MADVEVDPEAMREYAQVVDGLHQVVDKIDEYMRATACDKSGFTGLFMVLRPVVDLVGNLYGETLKFGHSRLTSLSQGVQSAADAYASHDENSAKILDELRAKLESMGGAAGEPGGVPDDFPTMPHPAGR
ncbi:MAG TPA: type VII secretion target [Amycolatopsis sp.]|uniref:Type VII secretion target n=1 Tax=Amycolatopsis nalaikhensis TaxID=715472 RepID=A0ABY8XN10_9PSEU|nr:type VII secretion target [Amycolatopsis sp. 2-2]WIV56986.1 type VII secretion target [Amycolatopsis sp. 2-2]